MTPTYVPIGISIANPKVPNDTHMQAFIIEILIPARILINRDAHTACPATLGEEHRPPAQRNWKERTIKGVGFMWVCEQP